LNIVNADRSEDVEQLLSDRPNHKFKLSFHNLIPLLFVKLRLLSHFVNVDKFYNFLAVVNQTYQKHLTTNNNNISYDINVWIVGKLAGNDRVLHLIKSDVLDSQNLPSRQFTVRDKDRLSKQIISIIQRINLLNKDFLPTFYSPGLVFGDDWFCRTLPRKINIKAWSLEETMFVCRNYFLIAEDFPHEVELIAKLISRMERMSEHPSLFTSFIGNSNKDKDKKDYLTKVCTKFAFAPNIPERAFRV
jgi:hypothetical protein